MLADDFQSLAAGVGHPVQALPDVRSADARSAQIRRPDGVPLVFQVSRYSVEPSEGIAACNLFTKYDWRSALRDELEESRLEVAGVFCSFARAGETERLAGA